MIARNKEVLREGFFKWPFSDKRQTILTDHWRFLKWRILLVNHYLLATCMQDRRSGKKTCHTAQPLLIRSLRVAHSISLKDLNTLLHII